MLLKFSDNNPSKLTSVLEYTDRIKAVTDNSAVFYASILPMLIANSPNITGQVKDLGVECLRVIKSDYKELKLRTVFIELTNRYAYLILYNTETKELLYVGYCGEITLVNSVRDLITGYYSGSPVKNIAMVAPVDSIITKEEPYSEIWRNSSIPVLNLPLKSYINLNNSMLTLKRIGRSGRDLQVTDKHYITNRIQELYKALSHEPEGLINLSTISQKLNDIPKEDLNLFAKRLSGELAPLSRICCTTPLSSLQNRADIIVAIAKTKPEEACCMRISNDWLKRAVKHKLNKFPPENTSDGKYFVQKLTSEATIKYQGDAWKGAEKTDEIYLVTEKSTNRTIACISVGKAELEYIDNAVARRHNIESEEVEHYTIELESAYLPMNFISDRSDLSTDMKFSPIIGAYTANMILALAKKPGVHSINILDLISKETEVFNQYPYADAARTILATIHKGLYTSSRPFDKINGTLRTAIYQDGSSETLLSEVVPQGSALKGDLKGIDVSIQRSTTKAIPGEFNFPTLTLIIHDEHGDLTFKGCIKFGLCLLHNTKDYEKTILCTYPAKIYNSVDNAKATKKLCDYLFPTADFHEDLSGITHKYGKFGFASATKAIHGKKLKELLTAGAVYWEKHIFDMVRTAVVGRLYGEASISYGLGYIPDTYEEYKKLYEIEELYDKLMGGSQATVYTKEPQYEEDELEISDEELMDSMDMDDDIEEETYTEEELAAMEEMTDADEEEDYDGISAVEMENPSTWESARAVELWKHPQSSFITNDKNEKIYWFDVMHILMSEDQPENALNVPAMRMIWNDMMKKMNLYDDTELIKMMYASLNGSDDDSSDATDTNTNADTMATADLTDDDDDLFADL